MFTLNTRNTKLNTRSNNLAKDERGLTTVEYVILLVLIAVGSISMWRTFGSSVTANITKSADSVSGLNN
jgi:Flp pilus assembly pilin Flp